MRDIGWWRTWSLCFEVAAMLFTFGAVVMWRAELYASMAFCAAMVVLSALESIDGYVRATRT